MASGRVNRQNRPNTWLHTRNLRREGFPCQFGAVHTWLIAAFKVVVVFARYGGRQAALFCRAGAKTGEVTFFDR